MCCLCCLLYNISSVMPLCYTENATEAWHRHARDDSGDVIAYLSDVTSSVYVLCVLIKHLLLIINGHEGFCVLQTGNGIIKICIKNVHVC